LTTTERLAQARRQHQTGVAAETGNHCPVSGEWTPGDDCDARLRLYEGNIMPAFRDSPVRWMLVQPLVPGHVQDH
jgi:hypothetical protein